MLSSLMSGRAWLRIVCAHASALVFTVVPVAAAAGPGPTVQDVVEFTRLVPLRPFDVDSIRVSPDGLQAFIVTRRGDVRRDRTVYEMVLLELQPDRLASGLPGRSRTILTIDAATDNHNSKPFVQDAEWVDERTIVFRARLAEAPYQVYRLDVRSLRLTPLTHAPHGIVSFALSKDLSRVVYATPVPNPPLRPGARSVVVGAQSFSAIKFGQEDMRSQVRLYRYVAAETGSRGPGRTLGELAGDVTSFLPPISVSPDGRWAVMPRYEPGLQPAWAKQYPMVGETAAKYGPAISEDPLRYYSRALQWIARRHIAYRLSDGHEQVVLDAPDDAVPQTGPTRTDRVWSRDGRSVILAGTHLPLAAGAGSGPASHIVEYWPDTGQWTVVAALRGRLQNARALDGDREGFVAMDGEQQRTFVRSAGQGWRELDDPEAGRAGDKAKPSAAAGWTFRVDQGLNQPAEVVAVGPGGQVVRLTRLHPRFSAESWGTMRPYAWQDTKDRTWEGGLMVPAGYEPARRYPLVIQTYGFNPKRFYLDGTNTSGGATSGFAGRAFLRENLLVLAVPIRAAKGSPSGDRELLEAFLDGVQSAIRSLVDQGVADPERVGILGWSATGERVLNLLTFTDAPIRAASLLDGDANTLFTMTVSYGLSDGAWKIMENRNQGMPYGKGRDTWVRNDPALNTDCIRAAVRIESYGPWVLPNWDIHALLRRQYKPAEMVVIPDGTHALATPSERMISLQGNVDWYRFWLKGEERTQPLLLNETEADLRAQYGRWNQMAELKLNDEKRPRCARMARP